MTNIEYIKNEGLDKIIDFNQSGNLNSSAIDQAIPPDINDLVRLHYLIRKRKSFTVLEFGTGYSTIVIAHALAANQADWNNLCSIPEIRNRFMFKLFSVDASKKWLDKSKNNFPDYLKQHVIFHFSEVTIGTFNGQLCHYYDNLPDIVPDFIYLDGPDPKDVKGVINGMSFQCDERTVMSGDLLTMEPILIPGLFILVDGRTNNARFLLHNLKRKYNYVWDKENDISTFELIEDRLGVHNKLGFDYFIQ
jgi:hypothetical protein